MSDVMDHIRKRLKDAGYFANREVQEAVIELDDRITKLELEKAEYERNTNTKPVRSDNRVGETSI